INVEADVNQQLLRLMKENNCETLDCLEQKVREAGFDIAEVRRNLTEDFSRQKVISAEVYGKVYRNLTEKEKREYYEKNKQRYTEPAEVTLSSILIAFGKEPEQARLRAKEISTQAKNGVMEFPLLAEKNCETEQCKKAKGVLGSFKVVELAPEV